MPWLARSLTTALLAAGLLAGCGSSSGRRHLSPASSSSIPARLLREARPIGAGHRFHPGVTGRPFGVCRRRLAPHTAIHLEVFADDRVVLVPSGIGLRAPIRMVSGRVVSARCYSALVTLDTTGVVLVSRSHTGVLADVFRAWGQPLSAHQLLSFRAPHGASVRAFLGGRRWAGPPGGIPLRANAEIVLEVGPYVPPHAGFTFPAGG